jgi:hypothetical protein
MEIGRRIVVTKHFPAIFPFVFFSQPQIQGEKKKTESSSAR